MTVLLSEEVSMDVILNHLGNFLFLHKVVCGIQSVMKVDGPFPSNTLIWVSWRTEDYVVVLSSQ